MGDMATAGFVLGLIGLILGTVGMVAGIFALVITLNGRKALQGTQRQLIQLRTAVERPAIGAEASPEQAGWPTLDAQRLVTGTQELPLDQTRQIRDLRDEGKQMAAIKQVRELTGMGLADAVRFVERL